MHKNRKIAILTKILRGGHLKSSACLQNCVYGLCGRTFKMFLAASLLPCVLEECTVMNLFTAPASFVPLIPAIAEPSTQALSPY